MVNSTIPPAPSEPNTSQEGPVPTLEAMDVDAGSLWTAISEERTAPPTPREPLGFARASSVLAPRCSQLSFVAAV